MRCTVQWLLANTTSSELSDWQAYELLTGSFGSDRDDARFAVLRADIINIVRAACGAKDRDVRAEDLMPKYGKEFEKPRELTPKQHEIVFQLIAAGQAVSR